MPYRPAVTSLALLLTLAAPAHADFSWSWNNSASASVDGSKLTAGSGHIVNQVRQPGTFDAVQTRGSLDLDLSIGPTLTVSVEADDNLQPLIRTEVRDGTLVIDSSGSWRSNHSPRLHVVLPALAAVAIDGSGDAVLKNLGGGDFALRINGSGDVDAEGRVDSLSVLLNGSGDAKLSSLKATDAKVRINGSGDAALNVSRKLDAIVNGSGDISYSGDAEVSSAIHGSGSVEKK